MQTYRNTVIEINGTAYMPTFKASVSQAASITPRRVFATNQFDEYGIVGNAEYQLNMEFPLVIASGGWHTGNGYGYILANLTGDVSFTLAVGATKYNTCYLESLSLNIQPNAPIMCSASIKMFDDGSIAEPSTGSAFVLSNLHSKIAYGHNTLVTDWGHRAEYIGGISHSLTCARSYSTQIWDTPNNTDIRITSFLEGLEARTTIQHKGVDDRIPYTGYGGGLTAQMSGANGLSITLDVVSNARITNIDHNHEAGRNGMCSTSITQVFL